MATDIAPSTAIRIQRSPRTVVGGVTLRKAARSAVLWGYVFGATIAASAISYSSLYKTHAQREALAAAYESNQATIALFGPAPQLQTVAGFTVLKVSMTLMIIGAIWGLLTSTRLLRGEEDNGRWEMLLAGRTTRRGATAQAVGAFAASAFTLWAMTALITVIAGRSSKIAIAAGPALYFALAMVAGAVMFLAVGAFASQLAPTRRQAAQYSAIFLGLSYALRLVADAGVGLHGLIWTSPLGWIEQLKPLTTPEPLALLPILLFSVVLGTAAIVLAGARDVGSGLRPSNDSVRSRMGLLSGVTPLSLRLVRANITAWSMAIAVAGLLYGLIAKSAGKTIAGSSMQGLLKKLGAPGSGTNAVLGVCFLEIAVMLGFIAAGHVSAARSEESSGRLDHLLVRAVPRTSWLGGRLLVAASILVSCGAIAGIFAWMGALSQHAAVSFGSLLNAGVNTVAPSIIVLGVGTLMLGVWPRATSIAAYAVLGWAFLIEIVGGIGATNHWILDTSVFHQMVSAPAAAPNWQVNGVMVAIGAACAIVGIATFQRRDLQGE